MAPQQTLTDEERSTLIIMVRSRSVLYNDNEKGKSSTKKEAWSEIASAMSTPQRELTPEFIASQWKNLRDGFIRQHRNCGSSAASSWKYYEKMAFLLSQPSIVNVTENKGEKKEKPPKEPKKKAEKKKADATAKVGKKAATKRENTPTPHAHVKAEPVDTELDPQFEPNDQQALTVANTVANAISNCDSLENASLMSDDAAPPAKMPRFTSTELMINAIDRAAAADEEAKVFGSSVASIYESVKNIDPAVARMMRRQLLTLAINFEDSLELKTDVKNVVDRVLAAVDNIAPEN